MAASLLQLDGRLQVSVVLSLRRLQPAQLAQGLADKVGGISQLGLEADFVNSVLAGLQVARGPVVLLKARIQLTGPARWRGRRNDSGR